MVPALPLLLATLVVSSAPVDKAPANVWQETVLLKEKDLIVRLKVLGKASLADTDWLALEFENRGRRSLTLRDGHYWMTAEYRRLGDRQLGGSGNLASGSTYDLFPQAWATTPVSPIVLLPGKTYRAATQPSDYSAALLGLPPPPGRSIRARVFIALNLSDGRQLRVAEPAGVPFAFDWIYPDDAGFKALRARLGQLLRSPENKANHHYLLDTYLGIPQVAGVATVDELVAALDRRRRPFEGRSVIAAHLAKHFGNDPVVTVYYRQRLNDGDDAILSDLHHATLWAKSHVKPLVGLYESNPAKYADALTVLHRYRDDWIKDGTIVRRLSAVVQRQYPLARQDVGRLTKEDLDRWADAVERLSLTGDLSAISLLRPPLNDKRSFRSTKFLAMPGGMRVPPLRVCDVALDAILTLLDGSPDAAYRRAGPRPIGRATLDAAYAERRDRMIADLKGRLAAWEKGN